MGEMTGDDKILSDEISVLGKIKFLLTFLFVDTKEAIILTRDTHIILILSIPLCIVLCECPIVSIIRVSLVG
jgi:hypothetical protein